MSGDISKSERGGKSVYVRMGVWYDGENGHIRLTVPGSRWFHTTVSNDPTSVRGNPNLYSKLARVLREAGAPAPDVDDAKA